MKLEICANSYRSALHAQQAGADRIELCVGLALGGLTPSHGLIAQVMQKLDIPVHVLIRPRAGNFNYSEAEFEIMKSDIAYCKSLGCAGVVAGVLHEDLSLDVERTKILVELARPLSFTFHRAFDMVPHPMTTLRELMDIHVDRILTSGQQEKAEEGIELITKLQEISNDQLIIMPGSGINPKNVAVFKQAGCKEVHSSASKAIKEESHPFFGASVESYSDVHCIQELLRNIANAN